jgi:hypothetical protein
MDLMPSYKQIFQSSEPTEVEAAQRRAQLAEAMQQRAMQPTMYAGPQFYDGRTAMADLASALTAAYSSKRANDAYDRAKQAKSQKVDQALKDYSKSVPDSQVGAQSLANINATPDGQLPQTVTGRSEAANNLATSVGPGAQSALAMAMMERDMGAKHPGGTHVVGNALVDDTGKVVYQGEPLDNMYGRINPGDFTPESLRKYNQSHDFGDLVRAWAPVNPTVQMIGGAPNLVAPNRDGSTPKVTALSTLDQERAAAQALAASKATGTAVGDASGAQAAKAPARASFDLSVKNMRNSFASATQGGPMGISGRVGKVFDYGDAKLFDSRRQQMSTELRTVFRIPGEGTLSDQEQQQYGLQLPDLTNPPEVNEQIVKDLEARVQARIDTPIGQQPASQSAAPSAAPMSFATEAEAEAAGIKPGTRVIIGGTPGTWQ